MSTAKLFDERKAAETLASRLQPFRVCGSKWFLYRDGRWQEKTRNDVRPFFYEIVTGAHQRSKHESQTLNFIEGKHQSRESQFRGAVAFDGSNRKVVLINVLNGTLRVTPVSVELLKPSPDHFFTRQLQVHYDPLARCALFLRTMEECLPHLLDRKLIKIEFGNILYPSAEFEAAFVWYGKPNSGKSTLAHPIALILGDGPEGSLTRLSLRQVCESKCYSLPKLKWVLANLGTELDSREVEESSNFKTIVSGEPFDGRAIYDHPGTVFSHCKMWFLSNNIPVFKRGTNAEARRIRFTHFNQVPAKLDVTLKSRLEAELPGIFNVMVEGLQELMALDAIPQGGPESCALAALFQSANDPLDTFVERCCILDQDAVVTKERLFAGWKHFCQSENIHSWSKEGFFKVLKHRHPGKFGDTRPKDQVSQKQVTCLSGLRFNPEFELSFIQEQGSKQGEQKNDPNFLNIEV